MTENIITAPFAGAEFDDAFSPVIISDMPYSENGGMEARLANRFMRQAKKKAELVYEFTRDPALISQYCNLYDMECGASVPQFQGIQSEYNKKGYIIVARQGNLCVGGARLSVSTPRQPCLLSMETGGFLLNDYFPELKQREMRYGQLSRLVLLPDFRDGEVALMMLHHLHRKALALRLDRVYAIAPLVNARSYRKNAMGLGMKSAKIYTDILVPSCPGFEEVKEYLLEMIIDTSLFNDSAEITHDFSYGESESIKENI